VSAAVIYEDTQVEDHSDLEWTTPSAGSVDLAMGHWPSAGVFLLKGQSAGLSSTLTEKKKL